MNKRPAVQSPSPDLISIASYALNYTTKKGNSATVQYIYNQIYLHKKGGKKPPFEYVEIGKQTWIKK